VQESQSAPLEELIHRTVVLHVVLYEPTSWSRRAVQAGRTQRQEVVTAAMPPAPALHAMVAHSSADEQQVAAWTRMYEAGALPNHAYLAMVTAWATAQARASFEHEQQQQGAAATAAAAAAAPARIVVQAAQVSPAKEKQDDEWLPRCRGGSRTNRTPSRTAATRGQAGRPDDPSAIHAGPSGDSDPEENSKKLAKNTKNREWMRAKRADPDFRRVERAKDKKAKAKKREAAAAVSNDSFVGGLARAVVLLCLCF
jgi:hypothetical protein